MQCKVFTLFLIILLSLFFNSFHTLGQTQKTLNLTLKETVELAQTDAPNTLLAATRLSNNYWQFQSFLADYKPQISLNANFPELTRAINSVIQPDGTIKYIPRSLITNSLRFSMAQRITKTGGTFFVSTGLERTDALADPFNTFYYSTPIRVGFNQPIFAFNSFKWDKKIQPLEFDEAKRQYSEDKEQVAYEAAGLFFDVFIAQLSMEAAQQDKANTDTLFTIAKGRYSVGKIAETDLLQVEISSMNADAAVQQANLDLQTSTENLRNFLGIKNVVTFNLSPPTTIPDFTIDANKALEYAKAHRSEMVEYQRRLMEAERNVDRAKGENGINGDIFGSFGLSQTGGTLGDAYRSPLDQELVTVSITVPIKDWGKAKSEQKIAESNQKLVQMQVSQDRINFERDILLKVRQFDLVRTQTKLAERTYEVAQKNFDLTKKRYIIGKIGVTDLNLAITDQTRSRRSYMSMLRSFWLAYYDLRRLTLYDFMDNKKLDWKLKID